MTEIIKELLGTTWVPVLLGIITAVSAITVAITQFKSSHQSIEAKALNALQDRLLKGFDQHRGMMEAEMNRVRADMVEQQKAERRWREDARKFEEQDSECQKSLALLRESDHKKGLVIDQLKDRINALELRSGVYTPIQRDDITG